MFTARATREKSVSYTHLDVYKRQEYDLAYQSAMAVVDQIPENGKVLILGGAEGYSGSILRGNGFKAVSYTHLDVYKRQG